jgi:hypothetical protein
MTDRPLTVEDLECWALAGAHWQVVELTAEHAVIDLCTCHGELAERRQSGSPQLLAYLQQARSDLDAT